MGVVQRSGCGEAERGRVISIKYGEGGYRSVGQLAGKPPHDANVVREEEVDRYGNPMILRTYEYH